MTIRIAHGLSLPIGAVTEKLGFIGRTGSGKTYAAQKLAEEMHRVGAQFVALDPVGKWWSLRLAADGKTPSIPVPVFGGLHGDVPLEPTAGKLMADVIVDRGISAVVDVSQFESDAAKARFMTDFGNRFFFRKKAAPSAVHLFIEECQEFVPQNPQRDEAQMLHAWTRIQKLGRNFGIGSSLLSQRPQEVNKKVLNQTEVLFVFQLTGNHERKSVAAWIEDKGLDEDIAAELPKLEQGCPHVWSPAWLKISKVVRISEKITFDASRTPEVGRRSDVKELAPIDLEKLRTDMAATIERAKAEDPRELRRRIAVLEVELRKSKVAPASTIDPKEVTRICMNTERQVLESIRPLLKRIWDFLSSVQSATPNLLTSVSAEMDRSSHLKHPGQAMDIYRDISKYTVPSKERIPLVKHRAPEGGSGFSSRNEGKQEVAIGKGERIILTAVAQYPEGASREQLTILTGYRRSSRDTYLQRLFSRNLVANNGRGNIVATEGGMGILGPDFEPLPTGEDLQAYWLNRLTGGERTLLEALIRAYPKAVDREALSEATEYKRSSRDTYLQRLTARRLVDTVGRGEVRASEELFG
jgi:hypothetical protein